ncbi:NUDIX hydrolase [Feifania hominis]|uniref:NUDIX domain-containing protein n=1 Tax=Feifania hominis TaxID=2763660 RepID=A0A926DE31_9FIRM|nr:NUDIX domain-containing protein [Feifania hominis]MBC8535335.1 NUDIX domain-containing protein [Feifania hominis]
MSEEQLFLLDEKLRPCGSAPRSEAHRRGLLHLVVHCWICEHTPDGIWLYFQQRAHTKNDFPDYYDLAVAGHVSAGEEPLDAMCREIEEEAGLHIQKSDLIEIGSTLETIQKGPFYDREYAQIYLLEKPAEPFAPGEEVAQMVRVKLEECCRRELEGASAVTAYRMTGEALTLAAEQWCSHPGELERVVLPALKRYQFPIFKQRLL